MIYEDSKWLANADSLPVRAKGVEHFQQNALRIATGQDSVPIEVNVLGRLPSGSGQYLLVTVP